MKKSLLTICMICVSSILMAQNRRSELYQTSSSAFQRNIQHHITGERSQSVCNDLVNYVGTTYGTPIMCGGVATGTEPWILFQVYPDFSGQVTRVEFRGSKIAANVNAQVGIWALDAFGAPTGTQIGVAQVTINGGWNFYGANFTNPINVTNGFAAGVIAPQLADSFLVACGPDNAQAFLNSSFSFDDVNGLIPNLDNKDFIIKPTIQFNMPSLTLSASPLQACVNSSITFQGTAGAYPSHFSNFLYNASLSDYIDFGDGGANVPGSFGSHSYATSGIKTPSYNLQYTGWGSVCTQTQTKTVTIDPPAVSGFSYGTVNLLLTVVNTSTNATTYNWNFGDLTTSNLQNPPVHDYGQTQGAGTYVVELTTTGVCGNGFIAKTINVQPGTSTGIAEMVNDISLQLYPNPVADFLLADYSFEKKPNEITIELMDAMGKSIQKKQLNNTTQGTAEFDTSWLSRGVYFVVIHASGKTLAGSFVKL